MRKDVLAELGAALLTAKTSHVPRCAAPRLTSYGEGMCQHVCVVSIMRPENVHESNMARSNVVTHVGAAFALRLLYRYCAHQPAGGELTAELDRV